VSNVFHYNVGNPDTVLASSAENLRRSSEWRNRGTDGVVKANFDISDNVKPSSMLNFKDNCAHDVDVCIVDDVVDIITDDESTKEESRTSLKQEKLVPSDHPVNRSLFSSDPLQFENELSNSFSESNNKRRLDETSSIGESCNKYLKTERVSPDSRADVTRTSRELHSPNPSLDNKSVSDPSTISKCIVKPYNLRSSCDYSKNETSQKCENTQEKSRNRVKNGEVARSFRSISTSFSPTHAQIYGQARPDCDFNHSKLHNVRTTNTSELISVEGERAGPTSSTFCSRDHEKDLDAMKKDQPVYTDLGNVELDQSSALTYNRSILALFYSSLSASQRSQVLGLSFNNTLGPNT
jgi:hypothetical protein